MDVPSGFRQPPSTNKKRAKSAKKPQLYEDTSVQSQGHPDPNLGYAYPLPNAAPGGYPQGFPPGGGYGAQVPNFPGSQFLGDPMMTNMAMQYGSSLADQGKEYVNKNLEKYVSSSKLKYYFAVDTSYVGKKLGLLLFPFTHKNWSIQYNQDEPVAPRFEVNAPDLYIPTMAFVTYILMAGIVMGIQSRFTPEQLGTQASTALVWIIVELVALLLTFYIMNVNTDLKYLDILAYTGYKFVGMILCLLFGLFFQSSGYYVVLIWCSITISFFLIQTLRVQILPHTEEPVHGGHKRRSYLILSISILQPLMMWWLTSYIVFYK